MLSKRGLGIKAKKCVYEAAIAPTAFYGAEAWVTRSAERRKANVLEMKCLRSLVGVSRMDRVSNEEVRRTAGIGRKLASRTDQRVLRWLEHVERMDRKVVLCGQEPRSGESTTTECGLSYRLLAVIYRSSPTGNSYLPSITTDYGNGVREGRSS